MCSYCAKHFIENADTNICDPCANQTVDLNAVMYAAMLLMMIFGYFGSLSYLTKAAMMFDMLDDDDSGYIELEELIDACRTYKKFTPNDISDERITKIYNHFCAPKTPGVPKPIFKAM